MIPMHAVSIKDGMEVSASYLQQLTFVFQYFPVFSCQLNSSNANEQDRRFYIADSVMYTESCPKGMALNYSYEPLRCITRRNENGSLYGDWDQPIPTCLQVMTYM